MHSGLSRLSSMPLWLLFIAFTVASSATRFQLTLSDTKYVEGNCGDFERVIAAVYDGHESIYIICHDVVFKYATATEVLTNLSPPPPNFDPIYHTAVGVGETEIYLFADEIVEHESVTHVWLIKVQEDSELTWTMMTQLEQNLSWFTTVWDGLGHIYIIGDRDVEDIIWKYSIRDHTLSEGGRLPEQLSSPAMSWDTQHNIGYIFGGWRMDGDEYSDQVLALDPFTERTSLVAQLPVEMFNSLAVWTGTEIYLVCGGKREEDPAYNFMRFDPVTNVTRVELVDGFDFFCDQPDAVFVPNLNRVYMFGNWVGDEQRIMYIEEKEEPCGYPELELAYAETKLPATCFGGSWFGMSAVYDGLDTVYIFCIDALIVYSLSSDQVLNSTTLWFTSPRYSTFLLVGGERLFYFVENGVSSTPVWEGNTRDVGTWSQVSNIANEFRGGSVAWNGLQHLFIFFGGSSNIVIMFSILDYSVSDTAAMPFSGWRYFSVVWIPEYRSTFLFGGERAGVDVEEIYRFDGSDNWSYVGQLPKDATTLGVVWTGKYAYLTCMGSREPPPTRLIRFDPAQNETTSEMVAGWDFGCQSKAVIYSNATNRIYMFGGTYETEDQPIMYIELDRKTVTCASTTNPTSMKAEISTTDEGTFTTTISVPTTTENAGCSATDKYGTVYEACNEEYAMNPCPGDSHGTAVWFCTTQNVFLGPNPDYTNCTSRWILYLVDRLEPGIPISWSTAASHLGYFQRHVQESANPVSSVTYFGHEIKTLFWVGQTIVELVENATQVSRVEELVDRTFKTFSLVVNHSGPWDELPQRNKSEAGQAFLHASDDASLEVGQRCGRQELVQRCRRAFDKESEFEVMCGAEPLRSRGQNMERITFPDQYNPNRDSYIEIPAGWTDSIPSSEYAVFSGLRLNQARTSNMFPSQLGQNKIINGPLMGFTFGSTKLFDKSEPTINFTDGGVRIHFQHEILAWGPERKTIRRRLHPGEAPKAMLGSAVCAYWDEANLVWSGDGCHLVESKPGITICECSHLTSFAVIMDLHNYIGKTLALDILTWVLCSLSICCLIITISVLLYSRYGRPLLAKHPRNTLTLGLCVCLLVSNVLILATMDKHNIHLSDNACITSAIVLHYTLLSAFGWMALEGILLAKLVFLDVFATGDEHARLQGAGAMLLPVVIVGATCAVNFSQGDDGYGNDAFCWLNGRYLWSFISIVMAVVIFNGSVLIASIRKSYLLQHNPNRKVNRRSRSVFFWIRGSLSLTVVMGLTWIAGLFMLVDNETVAYIAAYIFTVTNASQGILIFALHIASEKKVQSRFKSFAFTEKSTKSTKSTRST